MIREYAPAKINLFLDILSKRPDGYHNLGTLFQTIDVGDVLWGKSDASGNVSVRYDVPQEYSLEEDLVYRAAKLLKSEFGVRFGAEFYLEKKMPLGAGLGGGSADAAAALRLLNRIWGLGASAGELEKLGAKLGADVPFLVRGGSALAEGIGDVLTRISARELSRDEVLLVVTPKCAVPTKAAYAGCIPSGGARWESYRSKGWENFYTGAFNKFEESVLPQYPMIAQLKQGLLDGGALFALMSGSGASVFGIFENRAAAEKMQEKWKDFVRFSMITSFFPEKNECF